MLFGPLLVTPLTATASADGCPDAELVFARGTNEPPGIGRVGDALASALRQRTSMNIGTYAVNYPASYNFATAAEGANDASGHIQYMVDTCPGTRLVLGGYSQGAAVIDVLTAAPIAGFGFNQPLSPEAADHVAAVALFGNPSDRLGGLVPSLGPQYTARTIDLCAGGDPVCSDGRNWGAHTSYVPGMTSQAAGFVTGLL
ncbi:MAG TPA: cutinase family protein [Mycobacterium sp.]|nr:cutinase family protein [Mycobacterium sp.]